MESVRKNHAAVAMILVAATGWGVIGAFSRPLNAAGLSAIQITFVRSAVTLLGMGLLLLVKDRSLFRIHLRDLWMFLGTGLISIVFFNVCYFLTIARTTLSTASILLYTAPCFVMLMSALFFKERVTPQKLAALVLAFAGCMLVSGFAGGGIGATALLTGIGSGLGYASYSIFGKVALKKYETFTLIFYTFLVSTIGLLPFAHPAGIVQALASDAGSSFFALGLGLVSTFMPYILYTTGLRSVEAGRASVLAFAEPMVATLAGIVLFGETMSMKSAAGILLIFAAIVLLNMPLERGAKG